MPALYLDMLSLEPGPPIGGSLYRPNTLFLQTLEYPSGRCSEPRIHGMIHTVSNEGARTVLRDLADSDVEAVFARMDQAGTLRGFGVAHLQLISEDGAVLNGGGAVPGSA